VDERKPTKSRVLLDVRIPGPWIAGVLAAVVVLIVAAVAGFSAVNHISTCTVCHLVRPEVETYKQTAHYRAGVVCQQCHTKPGVFNYLIRNLQGMTNLILYASGKYERPLTTYVGSENCLQCHPNSQIEKDLLVGNIRINHTGLRKAGYQCITCHANISHPGTQTEIARSSQNVMSICARCHDGKQLPDTCSTCHYNGVPAEAPKVAMKVHVSSSQCSDCHKSKTFCADCHHGLTMPHPKNWTKAHGQVVLKRSSSICVSCHTKDDPRFCIRCHGLQIPHPGGWKTSHGSFALSDNNQAKCVKCHGKNSCIRCHGLQMPHPAGWVGSHPATASSSPGLCTKCHSSSFCFNCHGVSLPHSGSFIAGGHASQVYSNGGVCVKCHHNNGSGPQGCYGGQCHQGSIN
jgi:nitrate/TMAO reductase-like tetraheme cytochrome c subunit